MIEALKQITHKRKPLGFASLVVTLLAAAVVSACSGGSSSGSSSVQTGTNDATTTLQDAVAKPLGREIACPNLSVSASHATTGTIISLTGVPDAIDAPGIRVIAQTPDGKQIDPLFVNAGTPDGMEKFTTPLHPSRDSGGGDVALELGDGEQHCPPVAFTIDALPDAPADYARTVQSELEQWVDKSVAVIGYNAATLLNADPDDLPPNALSLWLAKQFVSGDRPQALPALSRAAANDDDLQLERLLKASHIVEDLDQALIELDMVPVGMRASATNNQRARSAIAPTNSSAKVAYSPQNTGSAQRLVTAEPVHKANLQLNGSCDEQAFDPADLMISSASELAARMQAAADGYVFDGSTSGTLLGSVAAQDSGKVGGVAGEVGNIVFIASTVQAARRALEPQSIESFEVKQVDTLWIEDEDPATPAIWSTALVTAKGQSFNLAKPILSGLISAAGMVPGPIAAATTVDAAVGGKFTGEAVDELTKDSCVRIRAPKYGPIRVDDEPYTRSIINGDTVTRDSHQTYHGVDIGTSELRIILNADQFPGANGFVETFPIEVQPIFISTADERVQQPGEQVAVSAIASNATTSPTNFSASTAGAGSIVSQGPDGDFYAVQFASPTKRDDFPTGVDFVWNGRTLPAGATRSATAQVLIGGDIAITPRGACLMPGESLDVSAELDGFKDDNQAITWTASAGRIANVSGLTATFVAPDETGPVQVMVQANGDDEVMDSVEYDVNQSCMKKAWAGGGNFVLQGSGTYVEQGVNPGPGTEPGDGPPPPGAECPSDDHRDDQKEDLAVDLMVNNPSDIPPISALFFTRSESIQSNFSHEATHFYYNGHGSDKQSDDSCDSVSLAGSNDSQLELSGTGDGTLSLSLSSELVGQCKSTPSSETDDVVCIEPQLGIGQATGFYYLKVVSDSSYRISGELACHGLAGSVGNTPVTISVQRYIGPNRTPANSLETTGLRNPDGSLRAPFLVRLDSCSTPDQVQPFDVSFKLDGPNMGDDNDLVVIQALQVGAMARADGKGGLGTPGIDYQPSTTPPAPGNYNTSAQYDFTMKLERR